MLPRIRPFLSRSFSQRVLRVTGTIPRVDHLLQFRDDAIRFSNQLQNHYQELKSNPRSEIDDWYQNKYKTMPAQKLFLELRVLEEKYKESKDQFEKLKMEIQLAAIRKAYFQDIDTVIVCNRGEVACDVLNEAKKKGLKTILLCQEEDKDSLAAKIADEVIPVKNMASASHCLQVLDNDIPKEDRNRKAIHPGYGFLSEDSGFTKSLEALGYTFIGPNSRMMRDLGDKAEAKRTAEKNGLKTIPGYSGLAGDKKGFLVAAAKVNYPVLIKNPGGGGGVGIDVANNEVELLAILKKYKSEDEVVLEKYLEKPKHLEFGLIGDGKGKVIMLPGVRECSSQNKHHQKEIQIAISDEEAEKLFPNYRELKAKAKKLAEAVKYKNAGTIEFLYDPKTKQYNFLEMNTRMQVERRATEDLTDGAYSTSALQIACAEGALNITQEDMDALANKAKTKYSIELRINAQKPRVAGSEVKFDSVDAVLQRLEIPETDGRGRVQFGFTEGARVNSISFNPMIGMIAGTGETFEEALENTIYLAKKVEIVGVDTNIDYQLTSLEAMRGKSPGEFNTRRYKEVDQAYIASEKVRREEELYNPRVGRRATCNN